MAAIATARLRAQHLVGAPFASALEAVRHFGAVQSQDYPAAKWALAQRVAGATDANLDQLFDSGAIVRTHVLRPTWHFVAAEDIRWMLELTGPRLHARDAGRRRELGIDQAQIVAAQAAWRKAMRGGNSLTRTELGETLTAAGIDAEDSRLMHLGMAAELDGVLISGPRRGKQMTWMLMDERAPRARSRDRDDSLRELAVRYFRSHGPAQLQDYVWWSGLVTSEARRGVELAGPALAHRSIDGSDYWFDPSLDWRPAGRTAVHLLPNFDELTVAYRDRSALVHADYPFRPELFAFSSILGNVITVGGELRGAWRKTNTREGVRVEMKPLGPVPSAERDGVIRAAARYSRFLERPVEVVWL